MLQQDKTLYNVLGCKIATSHKIPEEESEWSNYLYIQAETWF